MRRNSRILGFGGSGALVIAGIVCAIAFSSTLGTVLAFILISAGLVIATSLVFLEVGLSEDREREHEDAGRQRQEAQRKREADRKWSSERERERQAEGEQGRTTGGPRRRPYLSRLRGERRHLK
jgi:hypothetical protein